MDVESVLVTTGESKIQEKTEAEEWVDKGNNAYDANDYDKAITCYKKAADLDPNLVNAHYNLGVIYGKKEMLDNAIAEYNKVLAINPRYYAAHNNLGAVYMKKGRLDAAIATLKKGRSRSLISLRMRALGVSSGSSILARWLSRLVP